LAGDPMPPVTLSGALVSSISHRPSARQSATLARLLYGLAPQEWEISLQPPRPSGAFVPASAPVPVPVLTPGPRQRAVDRGIRGT
jgi:hypothetical protein